MKRQQAASTVLMVRPGQFSFNMETASSNAFQQKQKAQDEKLLPQLAQAEFDNFVNILRAHYIKVLVFEDTTEPLTPDAVFPNNWFTTDEDGILAIFPMQAQNRRLERRKDIINYLEENYQVKKKIDITDYEKQGKFLEGTGSMIVDHQHKTIYACLSPRTDKKVLEDFCAQTAYEAFTFTASDEKGQAIYHTNVMMCLGTHIAVVCLESIINEDEKRVLAASLVNSGHEIVDITFEQMRHFAGNMLELSNDKGEHFLVMSENAYQSLSPKQVKLIKQHDQIIKAAIPTIERVGGGGVRCMMAEIFL